MPIKCCKDCVPPQRFSGCHAKCSKYLKEKAKWEEEKARAHKDQAYIIYPSDFEMLACMHKPRKDKHKRRNQ